MDENKNVNSFILSINLIDRHTLTCQFINYLRCVLRSISAYTISTFTIQRLFIVYSPLSDRFKSTRSAWITMAITVSMSLLMNLWVPYLFEIKNESSFQSCDVKAEWSQSYFNITLVYICFIMLLPILSIFACNILIMLKVNKEKRNQKMLNHDVMSIRRSKLEVTTNSVKESSKPKIEKEFKAPKKKLYYLSEDQIIRRVTIRANSTGLLTKMLLLISFSYALCNLPYFVAWSMYYFELSFYKNEVVVHNLLFSIVEISEIFYILNYSIHFYIYCASGSVFRNQLKYSSKVFLFYKLNNSSILI